MAEKTTLMIDGKEVAISNPQKVLYPETGFTKTEIADYYREIAPVMLPHISGRPLTLHRFPNGVDKPGFYEKNCPDHRPSFVQVVSNVLSRKTINQCTVEDTATLVWMANLASLEMHPGLSKAPDLETPTKMTFDLDPGAPATIVECCRVAIVLRDMFAQLELQAFPKTSGSKGLHLDVPLNSPATFTETKSFANAVARTVESSLPDLVVSDMTKEIRKGKILIDWSQNDRAKTTVAPYSMRARSKPWVSTPLRWDEVESTAQIESTAEVLRFEPADVLERVEKHGDLFVEVATLVQTLPVMK